MTSKTTNKYAPEVRERAVRMVLEHEKDHASRWAAVVSIAAMIGCAAQTLHEWVKETEIDRGVRAGVPTDVAEKLRVMERENRELRRDRVSIKPDAQAAALASNYYIQDLGPIAVTRTGSGVQFAFHTTATPMGMRRNDDGTVSFVALDPTLLFTPLAVGSKDGKRTLIMRDGQHEFAYVER